MKHLIFSIIFLELLIFYSCKFDNQDINKNDTLKDANLVNSELQSINASQNRVNYPETFILMQNRRGIRIEYCVDRANLQLWISPQAGKSFSYSIRNWSNRDDHTNIFDRIVFPNILASDFEKCEYDAFHTKAIYKNQVIHISQMIDLPLIMIWFDNEQIIDFKTYGSDTAMIQSEKQFVVNHIDRGLEFQFAATIGQGEGKFQHQLVTDYKRSIYARAFLKKGQPIFISAELAKENIAVAAENFSRIPFEELLRTNDERISSALSFGQIILNGKDEMQELLDINRRIALSMQDDGGFMRAANKYNYYLPWFRDGGLITPYLCNSGWVEPAKYQANITLRNPNISYTEPLGHFFGQIMAGPITKWQEDGLFYVIWPVFAYWTQTGDDSYIKGQNLKTMENAMEWLENYAFDQNRGLFGRYYYSQNPLTGSHDDGWDNGTGAPANKWKSTYKENIITKSYDIYINNLCYSSYLMLSAMEQDKKAEEYLTKAKNLEMNINRLFLNNNILPSYGELLTSGNGIEVSEPFGMDKTDYIRALSMPPFETNYPGILKKARISIYYDLLQNPKGQFINAYTSLLQSIDNQIFDEDSIILALDKLMPFCTKPGKYLPMPNTIPEVIDIEDGNPFHDIRPMVSSFAPWYSTITSLGFRKLPFGIAARATKYINRIENYKYKKALLDISYEGKDKYIKEIELNGEPLLHSWQIPENKLLEGDNTIKINCSGYSEDISLISSTVRLESVEVTDSLIIYGIEAYGKNVLTFRNCKKKLFVENLSRNNLQYDIKHLDDLKYIEFQGRGLFLVCVEK